MTRTRPWRCVSAVFCLVLVALPIASGATTGEPVIAVAGAFRPELQALEEALIPDGAKVEVTKVNGVTVKSVQLGKRQVLFFLTGVSTVNAAMTAQMILNRWNVSALLFAGIAGRTNPELHPGDVVIPERWFYHSEAAYLNAGENGKYIHPEFYRPKYRENFGMIFPDWVSVIRAGQSAYKDKPYFAADRSLLKLARQTVAKPPKLTLGTRTCRIKVGGNGITGPVFLDNGAYREWCYRLWKADCTDMESTALGQVCWANQKPFLVVRALSDLAGGQKGVNTEEKFTTTASRNAALVLKPIVETLANR